MTTQFITHDYKGFTISHGIKSHSCAIYKGGNLVKCVVGDIFADGSTNFLQKAKQYIDTIK